MSCRLRIRCDWEDFGEDARFSDDEPYLSLGGARRLALFRVAGGLRAVALLVSALLRSCLWWTCRLLLYRKPDISIRSRWRI
jgi:hypothetical protein